MTIPALFAQHNLRGTCYYCVYDKLVSIERLSLFVITPLDFSFARYFSTKQTGITTSWSSVNVRYHGLRRSHNYFVVEWRRYGDVRTPSWCCMLRIRVLKRRSWDVCYSRLQEFAMPSILFGEIAQRTVHAVSPGLVLFRRQRKVNRVFFL